VLAEVWSLAISSASLVAVVVIGFCTVRVTLKANRATERVAEVTEQASQATADAAEASRKAVSLTSAALEFQKTDALRRQLNRMLFSLAEIETLADHIYYDVQNAPEVRFLHGKLQTSLDTFKIDVESYPFGLPNSLNALGSILDVTHQVDAVSRGCKEARQELKALLQEIAEELVQAYD
jgi:hypothetical protein